MTTLENAARSVMILLGVHNGAPFLPAQLRSLAGQHHRNWQLYCSDDGSTDGSMRILHSFAQKQAQHIDITFGPQKGFAQNYLSLLSALPSEVELVALCDQDYVWLEDKLTRAVVTLAQYDDTPTLYCARTWYWTKTLKKASPRITRPCTFENALVENVATGNTIVLNASAARLARFAARYAGDIFAHDWWLYLLITGVGGKVVFDNGHPPILYRQHDTNAIGAPIGIRPKIRRKVGVLQGIYANRIDANIAGLWRIRDLLTPAAISALDAFMSARAGSTTKRLYQLSKSGAYRQRLGGNIGLWGAAGLGKI